MSRRSFARSLVCAALVWTAACRVDVDGGGEPPPLVKSPPASVSTPDAWHLFDRSVSSGFTPTADPIQVVLDHAEQVAAVKVYGSAPYRLRVTGANAASIGFGAIDLSNVGVGWHVFPATALASTDHVELRFESLGMPAAIPELELWAVDDHSVPVRPDLATKDLPAGFVALPSDAPSLDLAPSECATAGVLLTRAPSELRRAYLVYETKGLFRPFEVQRTINGLAEQGGAWLGGDPTSHSFVEEIDPAVLNLGPNELRLCLPNAAANANVSNLRIVGELDRGVRLPSAVAIGDRDGSALLDGDLNATQDIAASARVVISFDRLIAPDALILHGKVGELASVECVGKTGGVEQLAVTAQTGGVFALDGASHACTQLAFASSTGASLSELDVVGSGAAEPVDWPRVVVTSPTEHFGDTAYVGGFVARAHLMTGAIRTTVAGQASAGMTGDFARLLTRTADLSSPWSVVVTARAPDGSTQTKQIVLDHDQRAQLATAKSAPTATTNTSTAETRYGREGQSTVVTAAAHAATQVRLGTHVGANLPAGALTAATPITVRHLADDTLPPLDPGMINVTAPQGHGYEFLPHGQRFAQPIEVLVPYDPTLIPDEMKPEDVHTFYYDPTAEHWKKLDRTAIDAGEHVIHSSTTHFTIMVDAVLTVPKNPSPLSLDPTSISSIGAASPAANIDLIEPPQANSTGDARLSLPIRVPKGRGAYTPALGISYSSSAGNGWLGVGWDLAVSKIEIDTRWGVPTYADGDAVRYLLDGAELVPSPEPAEGPTCDNARRYRARIEGAFAHILRCGADPASYHWEVHDRDGTLFVYGDTADTRLSSYEGISSHFGIFRWGLSRVVDVHANNTVFHYFVDDDTSSAEESRELYPAVIEYTSSATLSAAFTITFDVDDGTRPDRIVSGRAGFKMVTKHLLRAIHVAAHGQTFRDYILTYGPGQFGKSVLKTVGVFGVGGCAAGSSPFIEPVCSNRLDEHTFEYFIEPQEFATAVHWTTETDPSATLGKGNTATASTSTGGTVGTPAAEGTSGFSGSFSGRAELVGFYDVNGDGLPDQVFDTSGSGYIDDLFSIPNGSIEVLYNQWHPGIDSTKDALFQFAGPTVMNLPALGAEREFTIGTSAGFQSVFGGGNVGINWQHSDARRVLTDLDGDGFVDIANPGEQSLYSAPCFSGTAQCFTRGDYGATSGIDPSADPTLQQMNAALKATLPLGDPVVQWVAPFDGTITVTGIAQKLNAGGLDGVTVEAYHQDTFLAGLTIAPDATSRFTFPTPTSVDVIAGEAIYLRVKTGADDGIGVDGTFHDLVDARLDIAYTRACTELGCNDLADPAAARDPTNSPVFAFDSHDDLRVAGAPTPLLVPANGIFELHALLVKQPSTADVRVCVQLFAPAYSIVNKSLDRPCSASDADVTNVSGTFTMPAESSTALPIDVSVSVFTGQPLIVRVESDLSFDPGTVSLAPQATTTPIASYSQVCLPTFDGTSFECSSDASALSQVSVSTTGFGPFVPVSNQPPAIPFVAPQSGQLTVSPVGAPSEPFVFAVRSNLQGVLVYQDCTAASCGSTISVNPINTTAGESITFEIATAPGVIVPTSIDVSYAPAALLTAPLTERALPMPTTASPFVGGYRQIRTAFWSEGQPFAPATLLADLASPILTQARAQQIAVTIFLPTASFDGSGIIPDGAPGWLGPQSAAFVSQAGLNASWLGMLPPETTAAQHASLLATNYARISTTFSFFFGSSFTKVPGFSFDMGVSGSWTNTSTDLVDMNGDGIADAVQTNGVILGAPTASSTGAGTADFVAGDQLRRRTGHDYSIGFGGNASGAITCRTTSSGRPLDCDNQSGPDTGTLGLHAGNGLALGRTETTKDLIDVNGDGLPDLVRRDGTTITVRLNLGNRYGAEESFGTVQNAMRVPQDSFESNVEQGVSLLDSTGDALQHETTITTDESGGFDIGIPGIFDVGCNHSKKHTTSRTTRQLADINGDGLPDLLYKKDGDGFISVQLNQGGSFATNVDFWMTDDGWPVDLNNAFTGDLGSTVLGYLGALVVTGPDVLAGTGSQDSTSYECHGSYSPYPIFSFSGGVGLGKSHDTYELALFDVDGDGVADHVLRRGGSGLDSDGKIYVKSNEVTGKANLLQVIHRPLGGTITLDYARTAHSVDLPHSRQVLTSVTVDDGVDLGSSFDSPNVVTTIAYDSGTFSRNEKEFFGFAKVTTTRVSTVAVNRVTVEDDYDTTTYAMHGRLLSKTRRDASSNLFHQHVLTYATLPVSGNDGLPIGADPSCMANLHPLLARQGSDPCTPLFPVVVKDDDTRAEGGTAKKTRTVVDSDHDRFGNVLVSVDGGDDAIATDDVYAAATYRNDTTNWILGRATELDVRAGTAGGALLRSRTGDYDDLGELVAVHVDTGSGTATTTLSYDAFGNLSHVTTPPNESAQVQTFDVVYDGDVATYPIQTVDGFGYTSSAAYDVRFGVATSETDINGQTLTRTLDAFGRLATVSGPYDAPGAPALTMSYYPDDTLQGLPRPRAVTMTHTSAPPDFTGTLPKDITTVTFVDGLGRAIELNKTAVVDGVTGMTSSGLVKRDDVGRVIVTQNPFFTPGVATTFITPLVKEQTTIAYDSLDRPVLTTYPDMATEQAFFDVVPDPDGRLLFLARAIDPNGHTRESYVDHVGRTRTFVEHPDPTNPASNSITRYDYLPTGELSHITDAEGNQTQLAYDLRGLRTVLDNPDDGRIEDGYDLMGNRVRLVEPNQRALGTAIHYIYERDRLVTIDYPSKPDVTFTYGAVGALNHGAGRIIAVADETGTQAHEYGALGEVRRTVRTVVSANQTYTFDLHMTSDSLGRLLQLVYPDGEVVTNSYDDAGMIEQVDGVGTGWTRTYASDMRYDQFGNRTKVVYGNGAVSTWKFDPQRIRLQEVTTTLGSFGKIQDLQYSYDPASNPTQIVNALGDLNGGSGTMPGKSTLTLKYDGVDRLTNASGSAQLDAQRTTTYVQDSTYSASHNLLHKQRVHSIIQSSGTTSTPVATNFSSDYIYGARPHLPTLIGPLAIAYDPSGNPLSRTKLDTGSVQNLTWDDDNRMVDFTSGGVHQHNTFDASGTRVVRKSIQSETVFSSQYFDLENGTQGVKHVFAGSQRVASELNKFASGVNPVAPSKQGTAYFFHQDHLASTHVLTDDKGGIQESLEYFADGEQWIDRGPQKPVTGYLFSGKPFDPDTGFYDFGQRFYEPRTSLWLGVDAAFREGPSGSVGRPMALAALAFAGHSPVRLLDRFGLDPLWKPLEPNVARLRQLADPYSPLGAGLAVADSFLQAHAESLDALGQEPFLTQLGLGARVAAGIAIFVAAPELGELVEGGLLTFGASRGVAVFGGGVTTGVGGTAGYDLVRGEVSSPTTYILSGLAAGGLSRVLSGFASRFTEVAEPLQLTSGAAPIVRASSRVLGRNLIRAGFAKPAGAAAHHIVAGGEPAAAPAQAVLQRFGIGINDAENGVWLPGNVNSPNPTGAAVHSTLHTRVEGGYYDSVNAALAQATTREEALDVLSWIRQRLQQGIGREGF